MIRIGDELRTPAPGCPACEAHRVHTPEDWREFHPLAGHGYTKESGWTHPVLEAKARGEVQDFSGGVKVAD